MDLQEAPCSTLLVVDDDEEIRGLLSRYLGDHGFRVQAAADGVQMRQQLVAGGIDLVILDLMLPGEDGLSLCRWLRSESALPVIMLTARGENLERVVGLEVGADDYVTKPFDPRELVARIRAIFRRVQTKQNSAPTPRQPADTGCYAFDGWRLDARGRTLVDPDGKLVDLSPGEFDLLLAFVESPRRVLDREHLLDRTRGRSLAPFDRTVDVQISRLRRKLERVGTSPPLIRTVRGVGYIFAGKVGRE